MTAPNLACASNKTGLQINTGAASTGRSDIGLQANLKQTNKNGIHLDAAFYYHLGGTDTFHR
jgi:hypothetical protein